MDILYVEDDSEDIEIFSEVVSRINPKLSCVSVRSSAEALQLLKTSDPLPTYIFLDLNMPKTDGKECLKLIKEDQQLRAIPVVIYTTSTNPKDEMICKQLRALDYVVKPNTFDEAVVKLSKFFS